MEVGKKSELENTRKQEQPRSQAACRSSGAAREAFCVEHDAGADCEPAECSSYRHALEAPPGQSGPVASAWMKAKCR